MSEPRVEMCCSCFGDGGDHDVDGRWCVCGCCGGRGEIILCEGLGGPDDADCGGSVTFTEMQEHGAYCNGCRAKVAA